MNRKFTHYVSALLVTIAFIGSVALVLGLLIIAVQKIGHSHPMVMAGIVAGIMATFVLYLVSASVLDWMDDLRRDKEIRSMVKIKDNKYDRK